MTHAYDSQRHSSGCSSILCMLLRVKPPTIFQLWRASFSIAFIAVHIQRYTRVSIHAWYYEQFYSYYRVTARIDANTFDQICVRMMLKYSISFFPPLYTIPMLNIHGMFCMDKEASASTAEAAVIFSNCCCFCYELQTNGTS